MEPTVSMTLSRYKELESAEIALDLLKRNPTGYYVTHYHGQEYMLSSESFAAVDLAEKLTQAIKERDETIKRWRSGEKYYK